MISKEWLQGSCNSAATSRLQTFLSLTRFCNSGGPTAFNLVSVSIDFNKILEAVFRDWLDKKGAYSWSRLDEIASKGQVV